MGAQETISDITSALAWGWDAVAGTFVDWASAVDVIAIAKTISDVSKHLNFEEFVMIMMTLLPLLCLLHLCVSYVCCCYGTAPRAKKVAPQEADDDAPVFRPRGTSAAAAPNSVSEQWVRELVKKAAEDIASQNKRSMEQAMSKLVARLDDTNEKLSKLERKLAANATAAGKAAALLPARSAVPSLAASAMETPAPAVERVNSVSSSSSSNSFRKTVAGSTPKSRHSVGPGSPSKPMASHASGSSSARSHGKSGMGVAL
jgi:hypothetical protein